MMTIKQFSPLQATGHDRNLRIGDHFQKLLSGISIFISSLLAVFFWNTCLVTVAYLHYNYQAQKGKITNRKARKVLMSEKEVK